MPRNKSAQITFNVTDKKVREELHDFAKSAGFNSAGELARHLLQEASGIYCTPDWGGKRNDSNNDN